MAFEVAAVNFDLFDINRLAIVSTEKWGSVEQLVHP